MNTNYDCPACGAPNQTGTFCEYCKRRLKEPLISRTVLYGDGVPVMEYEEIMGGDTVKTAGGNRMKSDYMIEHVFKDGAVKYGVYRLKDISKPDAADNREYTGVYEDYGTACFTAAEQNIQKELNEG